MIENSEHTFVILAYKESPFLEECIKSVLNQRVKTNVIIATTTPNKYITNLSKKYKLEVVVGKHTCIGGDFDFALNSCNSKLVTIAHQDDIYDFKYTENIINEYKKYPQSLILFTDYYEIRNNAKVYSNLNLSIKRVLLTLLKIKMISGFKFAKRSALCLGDAICCPSVTFVKDNCPREIFMSDFKCNVDWFAWEKLSKLEGNFIYISKRLMGHRIDESTTTTDYIKKGIRTQEDLIMFKKFWPNFIAKGINKFYTLAEGSNNVNKN